jgi:hypothetical protein
MLTAFVLTYSEFTFIFYMIAVHILHIVSWKAIVHYPFPAIFTQAYFTLQLSIRIFGYFLFFYFTRM